MSIVRVSCDASSSNRPWPAIAHRATRRCTCAWSTPKCWHSASRPSRSPGHVACQRQRVDVLGVDRPCTAGKRVEPQFGVEKPTSNGASWMITRAALEVDGVRGDTRGTSACPSDRPTSFHVLSVAPASISRSGSRGGNHAATVALRLTTSNRDSMIRWPCFGSSPSSRCRR